MAIPLKFKDLLDAFELSNDHARIFVSRGTGEVYWHSEYGDNVEELPEDIDDDEKYIELPSKRDLGLGKPLVLDFVRQFYPDELDEAREMFSRRGAYARFRAFLIDRNARDRWYDFEAQAAERALREWCEANSIGIVD